MDFDFTQDWVEIYRRVWTEILGNWPTKKILEIGSFEGRSTCFFIEYFSKGETGEIYCIDTWRGGEEHDAIDMSEVEKRFHGNVEHALALYGSSAKVVPMKGTSFDQLNQLYAAGHAGTFDLVYIDGSHQAPDVLGDLVLSYHLAKIGGVIMCDDYVWRLGSILHEPKIAIDAFTNIFREKIGLVLDAPLRQLYFTKLA